MQWLADGREQLSDVGRAASAAEHPPSIDPVRAPSIGVWPCGLQIRMKCVRQPLCPFEKRSEFLRFSDERKVRPARVDDAACRAVLRLTQKQQVKAVVFVETQVGDQEIWLFDH